VRTALLGSLELILITIVVAFPIGVGAAIYLEEYAQGKSWFNSLIQTNIDNLAGVPSIVYGILGLALFVRTLEPLTSGAVFGVVGGNGRTILSAGLTMALLILPVIIINAQEAIKSVPDSLRQASFGLGATRWQTIWSHVLPSAMPGILTGTILSISRAIGETAPLIVVGSSTFITSDPSGPFSPFTALPIQIYSWTMRPQPAFQHIAAAASIVLLIMLLSLNAIAIYLRSRLAKRL
jgi:phosphate transport system permease protein